MSNIISLINRKKAREGSSSDQYKIFLDSYSGIIDLSNEDNLSLKISLLSILNYKSIEADITDHADIFESDFLDYLSECSRLSLDAALFVDSKYSGNGVYLRKNKHVAYYSLLASALQFMLYMGRLDDFIELVNKNYKELKNSISENASDIGIAYGNIVRLVFFKAFLVLLEDQKKAIVDSVKTLIVLQKWSAPFINSKSIQRFNELNANFNFNVANFAIFAAKCTNSGESLKNMPGYSSITQDIFKAAVHGPQVYNVLQAKILSDDKIFAHGN